MTNCKQYSNTSATTFDNNCVTLAEKGVPFVRLHGMEDGACTCRKGKECPSPGKHPIHNEWQKHATNDVEVLADFYDENPTRNLGIMIGPEAGIIDIEFDDAIGEATAAKVFCDVHTVAYKSGRSVHRLFKYSPRLPNKQKVTPKSGELAGLEIRIGGGEKATQSVAPPSTHRSGKRYQWLPGCDPLSVEIAELPRAILGEIKNYDPQADRLEYKPSAEVQKVAFGEKITEGERNSALFKFACSEAEMYGERLSRDDYQRRFIESIHARNRVQVEPPLSDSEVSAIIGQAIRYELQGMRQRGVSPEEVAVSEPTSEEDPMKGLIRDPKSGAVYPGKWKLYRVNADPVFFELHIPSVAEFTPGKNGRIQIPLEDIVTPGRVAAHILSGTGGQFAPQNMPGNWNTIWNGKATRSGDTVVEGLRKKLMNEMVTLSADPFDERWRSLLEYLLSRLTGAYSFDEGVKDGQPIYFIQEGGYDTPRRHPDGSVWFKWDPIWLDARNKRMFTEQEIRQLRKMIGVVGIGNKPHRYEKRDTWAKSRVRFIVFSTQKIDQLQQLLDR